MSRLDRLGEILDSYNTRGKKPAKQIRINLFNIFDKISDDSEAIDERQGILVGWTEEKKHVVKDVIMDAPSKYTDYSTELKQAISKGMKPIGRVLYYGNKEPPQGLIGTAENFKFDGVTYPLHITFFAHQEFFKSYFRENE